METRQVPRRRSDYRLEKIDDELLLYHPGRTKTLYLNKTASIIWELCDGRRSIADIVELLQQAFPETSGGIPEQIEATFERLSKHGAIKLT